ncbi:MAG: hypothetical protein MZU97_00100 [Bacillus subtilis]|nr:hypothetical protein [Bacillus subtilis]
MMATRRLPHVLDVVGADALLRVGDPRILQESPNRRSTSSARRRRSSSQSGVGSSLGISDAPDLDGVTLALPKIDPHLADFFPF